MSAPDLPFLFNLILTYYVFIAPMYCECVCVDAPPYMSSSWKNKVIWFELRIKDLERKWAADPSAAVLFQKLRCGCDRTGPVTERQNPKNQTSLCIKHHLFHNDEVCSPAPNTHTCSPAPHFCLKKSDLRSAILIRRWKIDSSPVWWIMVRISQHLVSVR